MPCRPALRRPVRGDQRPHGGRLPSRAGALPRHHRGNRGLRGTCAGAEEEAARAGVMLLPGVGFDVCRPIASPPISSAAFPPPQVASRHPGPRGTQPRHSGNRRGVARAPPPGAARREDRPAAGGVEGATDRLRPGAGTAVALSWGDVSTAWHSTGIPDIVVYFAMPPSAEMICRSLGGMDGCWGALRSAHSSAGGSSAAPLDPPTPRASGRRHPVGRGAGRRRAGRAAARLRTPEGYTLTAMTAVACVERVLGRPGATRIPDPLPRYGADFILEMDGVRRDDLATPARP